MTSASLARAFSAFVLAATPVVAAHGADAENPPPEAEQKPVSAFGRNHPSCREWTDGCLVCAKQADDSAACSTVGFAWIPAAVACTKGAN
jgi:hypothetical protein